MESIGLNRFAFLPYLAALLISISAGRGAVAGIKDLQVAAENWRWIAYSPSEGNPNLGIEASVPSVELDLRVLRAAGFDGLVTYTATGTLGHDFIQLAKDVGFKGVVVGIWDPLSEDELQCAAELANDPLVLAICIGNEGLDKRYLVDDLKRARQSLHTDKPVTTAEERIDYLTNPSLVEFGDWLFPNAHPYFSHHGGNPEFGNHPELAVQWMVEAHTRLTAASDKFVWIKETGLPTAGAEQLNQQAQSTFFRSLSNFDVPFVYFEAFDLPWKKHLSVEPHWGLFQHDRTPKAIVSELTAASRSSGKNINLLVAGLIGITVLLFSLFVRRKSPPCNLRTGDVCDTNQ